MRVLILNCYSRNALAAARALPAEYEIFGATTKASRYFICNPQHFFKSPLFKKIIRHSHPLKESACFIQEVAGICRDERIDVVIPTGTNTSNILSQYKSEFESLCSATALIENYESLLRLTDKWLCYKTAVQADVLAPTTRLLYNSERCFTEIADLMPPLIIKPRMSFASHGVRFFDHAQELIDFVKNDAFFKKRIDEMDAPYVVQEVVRGTLHDATGCSYRGEATAILSQQRHVSLYDFGGGGIINRTTSEAPLIEAAKKILSHVSWNGIFEFDFIRDENGQYYLLECNPKIWGTTHLTIQAGLNVVTHAIEVFFHRRKPKSISVYETDLVCKFWFPEIIYHWFTRPRGLKNILRRIARTFSGFGGKRTITNFNWQDGPHLLGIVMDRADG